jgi:transcriptional regulator with XRE-family HTH domain
MKTPFAINLRIALNERDISQSELARRAGVTQSSISDYLNGLYEPKQDKVVSSTRKLRKGAEQFLKICQ